jgi:hypothetical protein
VKLCWLGLRRARLTAEQCQGSLSISDATSIVAPYGVTMPWPAGQASHELAVAASYGEELNKAAGSLSRNYIVLYK